MVRDCSDADFRSQYCSNLLSPFFTHLNQCRIKVGAIDAAALGPLEIGPRPRTRKKEVFSILVVISLVGTISGKSLRLLPPDVVF